MKKFWYRFWTGVLTAELIFSAFPAHLANAQTRSTSQEKAAALVSQMTPEQKIGQLFIVSFNGVDVSETSQIYDLVRNRGIGGVMFSAGNNNFPNTEDLPAAVQQMITSLQSINAGTDGSQETSEYIPLLVGISQEGDGTPNDQILNGLTPLPDEMAIGATWDTDEAKNVGKVQGQELSALGFNLFIGPSLDVLDNVSISGGEDLGVRTFGGDPYWVGQMGKAYISGIHEGSNNRMAVIAKNFPGRGESDRPPEKEVATVRKSLEQLKQIELAPFFAVTGQSTDLSEITDGLLLSHIRYQGFQGNIRATTKPVSFDSTALAAIMSLEEFATWRQNGGLIVSDDLGSAAVRKFFDPTGVSFDARQVAKNAFLAGNDLLYMGNLISTGDADPYTTVLRTLDYFVQKYNEDPAFVQKVDTAVTRILTLKYRLYGSFDLNAVLPKTSDLQNVGNNSQVTLEVARKSVTLINPEKSDMDTVLPDPPQVSDRIMIIADTITQKQCSTCADQTVFSAGMISDAILRLYGPKSGQQVQSYRIYTYTYENLKALLDGGSEAGNMLEGMSSANWIVFAFNDLQQNTSELNIFRRVFNERSDLVRNKRIIGMAFNAPYFLDATDISKLTAYYGFYSKNSVFIDTAARVLFQELIPNGKLPVSVPGVGYDLITATTPDPSQTIQLMLDFESINPEMTGTPSPEPTKAAIFKEGDSIPIRTGVILDHNGNPVPDGTVVRFLIDTRSGSGTVEQIETQTKDGIARTVYKIPSTGILEIKVTAEPATISQILRLDITNAGGMVTAIEPTRAPTLMPDEEPTVEPTATPSVARESKHTRGLPDLLDWFVVSIMGVIISYGVYYFLAQRYSSHWGIRFALLMICGGYLGYFALSLGLFGGREFIRSSGTAASIIYYLVGLCFGGISAFTWYRLRAQVKKNGLTEGGDQKGKTGKD